MSETVKPKFSPEKSYEWQPDAKFTLTGEEFGYVRTVIEREMKSEEVQRSLSIATVANVLQRVLETSVEEGIITEKAEEVEVEAGEVVAEPVN